MNIPATYDSSLPLREKILYVLSVLKKESVGELSVEITERDAVGRTVQVKLFPRVKVVFWTDHADKTIKILRIERLQRS